MALAPISIPPGIVKAATPLQVKNRYWDGNLIRWRAGKLLPVGGWERITATPLSSTIRAIFPWAGYDGGIYAAIGCEEKLFVLQGSTYTDVTPAGFTGSAAGVFGAFGTGDYGDTYYGLDTDPTYPRDPTQSFLPTFSWTIDNWGGDILAVASSDGRLLHWNHEEATAGEVGKNTVPLERSISPQVMVCRLPTRAPVDMATHTRAVNLFQRMRREQSTIRLI